MSATNRGTIRNERDFYATPREAFTPLLPAIDYCNCSWWEPACGDRRLIKWMHEVKISASGNDIQYGYDFLKANGLHEGIITNPPFSLALEFCNHAITHADQVFMLLRLNFLASVKRRNWFRSHEPSALFILSKRPSFTNDGKTDATDYCWMYWGNCHKGIYHL